MIEALQRAIADDERLAYALVFGSTARGTSHAQSDLDVAVGSSDSRPLPTLVLGDIAALLESASGRSVDVVGLDGASPALAYRVFRDGRVILERDRRRLVAARAKAVLEYLDFQPIEEQCARGVLAALTRGR